MAKRRNPPDEPDSRGRARGRPYMDRPIVRREERRSILIVCEGEETEPNYFKPFKRQANVEIMIHPAGMNTVSLVEEAARLNEHYDFDQVGCVFDRDEFSAEQFNSALELASNRGFKVAYSNEAFELWYLLHFEYRDTPISRQECIERLNRQMQRAFGYEYAKNEQRMYGALVSRQQDARRNAQRLLAEHAGHAPYDSNPSTTVHLLVQELLKNSRR